MFSAPTMAGFELVHHWHGIDLWIVMQCLILASISSLIFSIFAFREGRKRVAALALAGVAFFASAAWAADTKLSSLSAGAAVAGTDLFYNVQTAGVGGVKTTAAQIATFVQSNIPTSVTGGIGITVSPTTGAVVVSSPVVKRDNTATTDTITSADKGTIVTESNGSSVAVAITTAGFVSTDYFTIKNLGAGVATYTPSAGTIDGAATIVCSQNQSSDLYFDGTNWKKLASTCGLGALATTTPGSGVATAAAAALSAAGGLTSTIASGTSALGTGAISSATCASVVTTAATNTATTDVVLASFNGDPTAVTGYIPATAGMLTIIAYPTSGNVNFKVCNNTTSSITPGAITLNWRVMR